MLFPAVELFKKKNISYGTMASGSMATKPGRAQQKYAEYSVLAQEANKAMVEQQLQLQNQQSHQFALQSNQQGPQPPG